ncbi:CRISPR-associated protein Csm4 [Methanomicrobium sp. W14]|uniref:type III-A CRISPR-associated RAMP protein Csm4 n=1 Tax=Methanomicrobium sp. W14 TaxID=2817839 RepID=UPI001AE3269E|nr:type III-A CRISPR-associated RAMP protein Csm4 [Methanomicrobium sp. W14]MBP2132416.1 CRISPR-associated protein Csm4 [Methanomicrobium sp. W14]
MYAVYIYPESLFPSSIPSNTIFGALCSAFSELGFDVDGLLSCYPDNPPFLMSSGIPCEKRDNGSVVHFFPMPKIPSAKIPDESNFDAFKKFKKVRFLHEDIFLKLSKGELKSAGIMNFEKEYCIKSSGILIPKGDDFHREQLAADVPHNQINRMSSESEQFFYSEGCFYKEGSGFCILVDLIDDSWKDKINAGFSFLKDRGIGKEISVGGGSFEIEFGEYTLPEVETEYLTSISRYLPEDIEQFNGGIWYDPVTIHGRSTDGFMKKQVIMLKEGSVFRNTGKKYYGSVAMVRENPPVVEYGMAFTVPWGGI